MRRFLAQTLFILICANAAAQSGAYMIPQAVYVGDKAVYVLPLPALAADEPADIVLTPGSADFPYDPNIDFHRIILERRRTGSRLLIEFSAFQAGVLEMPPIEIGSECFAGLKIVVRSVIDSEKGLELAGPASQLAIPGTGALIYGTLAVLILLPLFIFLCIFKGRRYLSICILKWKRRRLFVSMKKAVKRRQKVLMKGIKGREILDAICGEFRFFLSSLTGENCMAMTAGELERLPLLPGAETENSRAETFACILRDFFRRSDELRFSGGSVNPPDVFPLLADLALFIEKLEKEQDAPGAGLKTRVTA
jgi:hypothetical protein